MLIVPVIPNDGTYLQGHLSQTLTPHTIALRLGFGPNLSQTEDDKSDLGWAFTVDGVQCAIWDYKQFRWSYFGPKEIFVKLFGAKNVLE